MKTIIKKTKELLISLIIFIPILIIYTLLAYFEKIDLNKSAFFISSYLVMLTYFFIVGLLTGLIEKRKGIINGLIISIIIVLLGFLCSFITKTTFSYMTIIKYASYIFVSVVGSIIGVNLSISLFKHHVLKDTKKKESSRKNNKNS